MRYDRAVGKQASTLGVSWWDSFVSSAPVPAPRISPWSENYWNAGVNQAYSSRGSGGDTGLKPRRRKKRSWLFGAPPEVGVEALNRAQSYMEYGNPGAAKAELGDLFNDIMGAIVPGWDMRPQALKDIRLKADPNKLMAAAQKLAPGAGAQAVRAANAAGLDVYVDTPAGPVLVTPEMAQGVYANYAYYTKARSAFDSVTNNLPMIAMLGGGALLLFMVMKRR